MTIVHPPNVEREADSLESLDWSIPCEYDPRKCDTPASLIVWYTAADVCGCVEARRYKLFCDPCWGYRNSAGVVRCASDTHAVPALSGVLRVERI